MVTLYQELAEKSRLLKKQDVFLDISSHGHMAAQAVDEPV